LLLPRVSTDTHLYTVTDLGVLAEDRDAVLSRIREKAKEMDPKKLSRAVSLYGKYSTQKKLQEMLQHAA
jgi:hypothetical protein